MRLRSICLSLLFLAVLPAQAQEEFLPPEEAYAYAATAEQDRILVSWIIRPGYYLYRERMGFASATAQVVLGEPVFPAGELHEDEALGESEIYRGTATFEVPYTHSGPRPATFLLKLKWQGCADAGLCYPPTTWETRVELPPAEARILQPAAAPLAAGRTGGGARPAAKGVSFTPVASSTELDRALAATSKAGRRTLLDFTADWCAPCKKMQKNTFPHPSVQAALNGFVLLQADVTQNSADDQALLKRFDALGPPIIAFFDAQGQELKSCRVKGYMAPEKFRQHIEACP